MATEKSVSLRDILRIFFSHKVFFIVFPFVLAGSAYIGNELKTPIYEAQVKMFVKAQKTTEAVFYRGLGFGDPVLDHSELIKSNPVLNRVIKALRLDKRPLDYEKQYASPLKKMLIDKRLEITGVQPDSGAGFNSALGRLSSSISVIPITQSKLFFVKVEDFNPREAVRIANSLSRSYIIFDLEQNIEELKLKYGEKHSVVLQLKDYIENYEKTLHGELIPDMEAMGPASVKIVAQAEGAAMRRGVSKNFLVIFAFLTGIVLAVVFAMVFELADQTFKTPRKIVDELKLPLLGSLPKRKSKEKKLLNETNQETGNYIKSFRTMSDQLPLLVRDNNLRSLLVTDAEGSQETAIICANYGIYSAQDTGRKVLIIDADIRNSSLSKTLNVKYDMGLADILEGKTDLIDTIQDLGSNLYILPSGKTKINPGVLMDSAHMSNIINIAKDAYELIMINCPDLKNYTDPVILSCLTDGTVLVLNAGKVKKQILNILMEPLRQNKVNIIGVILNKYEHVIPEIIYKRI